MTTRLQVVQGLHVLELVEPATTVVATTDFTSAAHRVNPQKLAILIHLIVRQVGIVRMTSFAKHILVGSWHFMMK